MKKKTVGADVRENQGAGEREKLSALNRTDVPLVRARKAKGRWVGADIRIDRKAIVDAIRRDRE